MNGSEMLFKGLLLALHITQISFLGCCLGICGLLQAIFNQLGPALHGPLQIELVSWKLAMQICQGAIARVVFLGTLLKRFHFHGDLFGVRLELGEFFNILGCLRQAAINGLVLSHDALGNCLRIQRNEVNDALCHALVGVHQASPGSRQADKERSNRDGDGWQILGNILCSFRMLPSELKEFAKIKLRFISSHVFFLIAVFPAFVLGTTFLLFLARIQVDAMLLRKGFDFFVHIGVEQILVLFVHHMAIRFKGLQ